MFEFPSKKASLKTKIYEYLINSYHIGYEMNNFFTEKDQIIMFEKLLFNDTNFRFQWKNGFYNIPKVATETMYLSCYIKNQSNVKKISRKILNYTFNNKLTNGAQNLLQGYMIEYSQNLSENINIRMNQIFCGIFESVNKRKQNYITKITEKVPKEIKDHEIMSYVGILSVGN